MYCAHARKFPKYTNVRAENRIFLLLKLSEETNPVIVRFLCSLLLVSIQCWEISLSSIVFILESLIWRHDDIYYYYYYYIIVFEYERRLHCHVWHSLTRYSRPCFNMENWKRFRWNEHNQRMQETSFHAPNHIKLIGLEFPNFSQTPRHLSVLYLFLFYFHCVP